MYGERYASRASAEKPIQASVISSGCQLNSLEASLRCQGRCCVSCKHMMRSTRQHAMPLPGSRTCLCHCCPLQTQL